jgi:hypothetical protein
MNALGTIVLTLFGLGLAALGLLGFFFYLLFRKQDGNPQEDETRTVQDMYRTLNALEERVGALETILGARRRRDADPGPDARRET